MKFFDKIKEKRQEKERLKRIERSMEKRRVISRMINDMYDLDTYNDFFKQSYEERYKKAEEVYGHVLRQPKEFTPYVEKAHAMDAMAREYHIPNFLWDSRWMCDKITKFAQEYCVCSNGSKYYFAYISVMPKFSECQELIDIFTRFYEKDEIEYNKEFYGQTIWDLSLKHHAMPLFAVLIEHIIQTHELPYPAYIGQMHMCLSRPALKNCKVSEDGLHLVKCSEYEFNEITGNHWANLSREEKLARALKSYEKFKPKD